MLLVTIESIKIATWNMVFNLANPLSIIEGVQRQTMKIRGMEKLAYEARVERWNCLERR